MMAVEHTNEFLDALNSTDASLVSLSYWGDEDNKNDEDRDIDNKAFYWVESPIRVFSLEGM